MKYFIPILAVIVVNTVVMAIGWYALGIQEPGTKLTILRLISIILAILAYLYSDHLIKKYEAKKKAERRKKQEEIIKAIDMMTVGIFFDDCGIRDVRTIEEGEITETEEANQ